MDMNKQKISTKIQTKFQISLPPKSDTDYINTYTIKTSIKKLYL